MSNFFPKPKPQSPYFINDLHGQACHSNTWLLEPPIGKRTRVCSYWHRLRALRLCEAEWLIYLRETISKHHSIQVTVELVLSDFSQTYMKREQKIEWKDVNLHFGLGWSMHAWSFDQEKMVIKEIRAIKEISYCSKTSRKLCEGYLRTQHDSICYRSWECRSINLFQRLNLRR